MSEQQFAISLRVNGRPHEASVPARRLLSDALRHDLGLTGTHVGCEHGVCGCCTVLLDGRPVRSCLMFAVSAQHHDITTVEGLNPADGSLHPIQQAFQDCHGLQCGFCTPGFIMSVAGLLDDNPDPSEEEIVEGISGNLCRCTGYQNIIKAVERAAQLMSGADGERPVDPTGPPRDNGSASGERDAVAGAETSEGNGEMARPQAEGQAAPYGPADGEGTPGEADGHGAGPTEGTGSQS